MKKCRKLSVFSMLLSVVLIGIGYFMIFVSDYEVDAQETSSYTSFIKDSFKTVKERMKYTSVSISSSQMVKPKYYEDIKNNYSKNIEELRYLEREIDDLYELSDHLLTECNKKNFNDYQIDNDCYSVNMNIETIVNGYISLKKKYNSYIEEYNKAVNAKDKLPFYESDKYNEYIDYNDDGVYSGIIK